MSEFNKNIKNLDEYQKSVVLYEQPKSSYLSVPAGAGSGKSTTMVCLAQKYIELGVRPDSIWMTTFSKNSVLDLKQKYKKMFPNQIRQPQISTLHSLSLNILKEYFPEYSEYKIKSSGYGVLLEVLEDLGYFEPDVLPPEKHGYFTMQVLEHIEAYQTNNVSSPNDLDTSINIFEIVKNPSNLFTLQEFYEILEAYSEARIVNGVITFSDMVYLAYWELKEDTDILAKVRDKMSVLISDESQDMDTIQFDLIELLVDDNDCRLVAVYDYLQTIYKFRYATPERLRTWSQGITKLGNFKGGAKSFPLLMNYRSDANIVKANNYLRRYSGLRESVPAKGTKGKSAIEFKTCFLNILEGNEVINIVNDLVDNQGYEYSDIAIIVRTNKFLKEIIEPAIIKSGIAYQTINNSTGLKLLDRELSYYIFNALSLYKNLDDKVAIVSIVSILLSENKQDLDEFADFLQKNKNKTAEVLLSYEECPVKSELVYNVARDILSNIALIRESDGQLKISEILIKIDGILKSVIECYNIQTYIRKDSLRVRNSIVNMVTQLAHTKKITALISLIDIMLDVTENYDKEAVDNVLRLGSIHSTKGAEYPVTISAGFTSAREIKDHDGDLTEKFYVQASRAIEKSIFVSSLSYQSFGDETKVLDNESTFSCDAKNLGIFKDYEKNTKLLGICRTSGIV